MTGSTESFYLCLPLNLLHFIVDLPFASWDIQIHHMCGILIILFHYVYSVQHPDDDYVIYAFYKTEFSTFFYVFQLLLTKNYWRTSETSETSSHRRPFWKKVLISMNQLLFVVTFFRFRIVDYYHEVVANPSMYIQFDPYFVQKGDGVGLGYQLRRLFLMSGLLGMYALNLYWFVLITKKITKGVLGWIRRQRKMTVATGERLTHWWTTGLILGNLFVAASVYAHAPEPRWFFGLDLVGIFFLVHACFDYHNEAYQMLLLSSESEESPVLDYYDPLLFWFFLRDKVAIHLRSFLCVATGWIAHPGGGAGWVLAGSAATHALALGGTLFYLASTSGFRDARENIPRFVRVTDLTLSTAVAVDVGFVLWRAATIAPSFLHVLEGFWFHVLFAWLLFLVPFYEYNHIVFHLGLWVQTYLLARCNLAS